MVFSSAVFVFAFLPAALGLYHVSPRRFRNALLVALSLVFYIWGAGSFVIWLLASAAIDYLLARRLVHVRDDRHQRRLIVAVSVVGNVALLIYFKYLGLAIEVLNNLAGRMDLGTISPRSVALPLAISFFTFQRMSFTFDVARGRIDTCPGFIDYLLFGMLFPHLVAGPIVRYLDIAHEIRRRDDGSYQVALGAIRFSHGLAKKVLIADYVAPVANAAFANTAGPSSASTAWVGALAYTLQLYFDFSGYSDMAIGLGQMFGFSFPENFKRPYSAVSVTDFWRRWHVSLSSWFRDYVFIPLGGSRGSTARNVRNIAIVFVVTGLWHGAAFSFALWGCYHGALVIIERLTGQNITDPAVPWAWARRLVTALAAVIGWVLFRATSVSHAFNYLGAMLGIHASGDATVTRLPIDNRAVVAAAIGIIALALPGDISMGRRLTQQAGTLPSAGRTLVLAAVLPVALVAVAVGAYSPFLYFRF